MTQQRKLTNDELQKVMTARHDIRNMCPWHDTDRGVPYWHGVVVELDQMAYYATTDGKRWVDPEPPIPDGYRLAVAGDEVRSDCKFWHSDGEWKLREHQLTPFLSGNTYIVPADRTPTDEDAKSRPEVMVRDDAESCWKMRVLVMVLNDREDRFLITDAERSGCSSWKQARHLYPGEKR